jgi:hypothetical protein
MAEQDSRPRDDLQHTEISADSTDRVSESKNPPNRIRRRARTRKAKKVKPPPPPWWSETLVGLLKEMSLVLHSAGLASIVPSSPVKGLVFVAVLVAVVFRAGAEHAETSTLCFGSLMSLSVVAVGLVVICVKDPSQDSRLGPMQDERAQAVQVKPLRYPPVP